MPTAQTSEGPDAQIPNSVGALLGSTASAHRPETKRPTTPRDPDAPATQTLPSARGHTPYSVAVVEGKAGRPPTPCPCLSRGWRPPPSNPVSRGASMPVPPSTPSGTYGFVCTTS